VLEIAGFEGELASRSLWRKLTGYSRISLVETAFAQKKRLCLAIDSFRNIVGSFHLEFMMGRGVKDTTSKQDPEENNGVFL
jgi:hypothetical protein